MSYQSGKIRVPIERGINTDKDQKSLASVELITLENGVFDKQGAVSKRTGYARLPTTVVGAVSGSISGSDAPIRLSSSVRALIAAGDELVAFDDDESYTYSDRSGDWAYRGPMRSVVVDHPTLIDIPHEQFNGDMAQLGGVTVYAWEDSRGGVRYSVIDSDTGAYIAHDRPLQAANAHYPKVRAVDNQIVIFWSVDQPAGASKIRTQVVIPANPFVGLDSPKDAITDAHSTLTFYDVCKVDGFAGVVYVDSATGTPKVCYVGKNGLVSSSFSEPRLIAPAYQVGTGSISIAYSDAAATIGGAVEPIVVTWVTSSIDAGAGAYVHNLLYAGLTLGLTGSVYGTIEPANISSSILHIASTWRDEPLRNSVGLLGGVGPPCWWWEISGTANPLTRANGGPYGDDRAFRIVKRRRLEKNGVLGEVQWLRHSGICSRAWTHNRKCYVVVGLETGQQSTYWAVDDDGKYVVRFFPSYAGGLKLTGSMSMRNIGNLPDVQRLSPTGSQFQLAGSYKNIPKLADSEEATTGSYSDRAIRAVRMDFSSGKSHRSARMGETTYVGGGFLHEYDGRGFSENGFHVYPEGVRAASVSGTAGELDEGGIYSYRAYWETYNSRGERTLSSYAGDFKVTLTGSDRKVNIYVPTLQHTLRSGSEHPPIRLALYRTENLGTEFFRINDLSIDYFRPPQIEPPSANDFNADHIVYTDVRADRKIRNFDVDPYNDEVPADPKAACSLVTVGKDRMFLAGLEDPNEIAYSKLRRYGRAAQFSHPVYGRSVYVDTEGGPITALVVMDQSVVVFKESRIFTFNGDGPNDLIEGQGGFSSPELQTSDVGCIEPRSVVVTPAGLMFMSKKGIWLLGRNMNTSYVGAPVEDYNSLNVTSADVVPGTNRVVFLTDGGRTLVYDYENGQWSTFTDHAGRDAAVANGVYHYIRESSYADVMRSTGSYTDDGAAYPMRVRTAWIRPGETFQDFARFRRVNILGEYRSPHALKVKVYHDYEHQHSQARTFDTSASLVGTGSYGATGSFAYGSGPYGGDDPVYRWTLGLRRQKGSAISVEMHDVPIDDEPGAGYTLSEIVVEALMERGPARNTKGRTQ